MADLKISELSALAGANLVAADELAIVDDSASETKKITVSDLIANGVTIISDDTIPGAKILFGAGDVSSAAIADSAITTAKLATDAVTGVKLANNSTAHVVATLPASGDYQGQLALDTDDNNLYLWDGSAWIGVTAPGSINTVNGSTTGEINIVASTSGSTVTISATIDDTTSAAQFLAGPTGSSGTVGYRTIVGSDLPTATTSAKGGVIVNGNGLTLSGDTLEIDNSVTSSATHHVVTYDANGLITGGRVITSADLPAATSSALGGVIPSAGLTVDVAGNLSIDNSVTAGTYTKVTVTSEGVVSTGDTLVAADIPDHSAAKLTSGTIGTSLIANDAITADKIADQSTTKFGGAAGSDNVTIFPTGDFQGQFFYDETTQDLYIYTGSSFVPITVLSGNLVNAGAYNASTNQMSSVTSAGSSAGFSVGAALPAPAQTNLNHYVVVDTSGTGTGAAPAVALAPPDMLLSQGVGTEYSLIDVSNAIAGQTASNISLIATGNIIATDVQAGIQELDTEKLQKAGDTMTGALGIGTASSIVFEGSTADDYETTLTVTDPTADRTITFPDVTGNVVTTGDTGTVTSTMILDGTIVNADINASAEIAVSKLADGAAYQILHTDSSGTGVEWTSNIDIPGTLDVTSTATFDSTVTVTGLITANGKVSFPAGTAAAPGLYSGSDSDTGIYAPGANEFGVATAGSAALTIDSSQRVGIGTISPATILSAGTGSGTNAITINGAGSSTSKSQLIFHGGGTNNPSAAVEYDAADPGLAFQVGNYSTLGTSERVRIDSSGKVQIGRTSPLLSTELTVGGDNGLTVGKTNGSRIGMFGSFNQDLLIIGTYDDYPVVFRQNNSEAMRITSSGRLLVGTSSFTGEASAVLEGSSAGGTTQAQLWLNRGQTNPTTDNVLGQIIFGDATASGRNGAMIQARVDSSWGSGDYPSRLGFFTTADGASSPTERMTIKSDGRVGIGTTIPISELHVENSSGNCGARVISSTSGVSYLNLGDTTDNNIGSIEYDNSVNDLKIITNNNERMRLDSSGRLLVGTTAYAQSTTAAFKGGYGSTTNPGRIALLRQYSAISGNNLNAEVGRIIFADDNGNGDGAQIRAEIDGTSWSTTSKPTRFTFFTTASSSVSPTEQMRISNNGAFTSYTNGSFHGFKTNATSASSEFLRFQNNATSITTGTTVARVRADGDLENANNSYTGLSDVKLKENIVDASSQWEDIKALRVRNYNFKQDTGFGTHTQLGVIAQETETVSPGLVKEAPDLDNEGNDLGTVTKSVNYSVLYMKAVKALQEAMERIETLEQRLTDAGL